MDHSIVADAIILFIAIIAALAASCLFFAARKRGAQHR